MSGYDAHRRSPRVHRRVVRKGGERYDTEDAGADLLTNQDMAENRSEGKDRDDDRRILGELPPHWGIFSERG